MAKRKKRNGLLVGLAGNDGHTRITRGDDFVIVGGNQEMHEKMQTTAIKFGEQLDKSGKEIHEINHDEFTEMVSKASR